MSVATARPVRVGALGEDTDVAGWRLDTTFIYTQSTKSPFAFSLEQSSRHIRSACVQQAAIAERNHGRVLTA